MIRLNLPNYTARETFELCKKGIGTTEFKDRFDAGISDLCQLEKTYNQEAQNGLLYHNSPLPLNSPDDTVVEAGITKNEFKRLYDYYLRDKGKPGRAVYDRIMVSARGKCPYCGGIGQPKNIDHYMPKAYFPQLSIFPVNLVPACRDCNMDDKGATFASLATEQIIHPYLDKAIFFDQQWVYAEINSYDPCVIEYIAKPPPNWDLTDRIRAQSHFKAFDLSNRYGVHATDELSIVIDQRRRLMRQFTPREFSYYLASVVEAPLFKNHWKRVMYQCLSKDTEFCSSVFEN